MCGINGIYLFDQNPSRERINQMNSALAHRGPDDEGVFERKNILLGHRRLSIIDLSDAGHQPMTTEDGRFTIIYNGELYNYKTLRFDLQRSVKTAGMKQDSYVFKTQTDTEVILAAFIRWGIGCLEHFDGMFAFAIWDENNKELFIARDRLGVKPLYYYTTENGMVFSSEIRSLLASGMVPRKLDASALNDYLKYQTVHAPATIIENVQMLMPGNYLLAKNGGIKISSYWSLTGNINSDPTKKPYPEVCKEVNTLLKKSVEKRLISDVPFGAFLSGGIDSSAVVGLMTEVSSQKINTFSVIFDEEEFSEAKYSRLVAAKFNTDHHEIKISPTDMLAELPAALKALDHPSGDGINTFIVSKVTRNAGIKMALSGIGSDELFGGYDVFKRALEIRKKAWLNAIPVFLRSIGGSALEKIKPGIPSQKTAQLLMSRNIDFNSFYLLSRQVLMDKQAGSLLSDDPRSGNSFVNANHNQENPHLKSLISRTSVAEISNYLQNVLLRDTDQMSMAHGLEVREPFLDYKLVEYVLGCPDKYKSLASPKKLLVDSLGDLIPPEVINRSKMGFTFPWKDWMKNELRSFCEQRIISLSERRCFNKKAVQNLWKSFLKDDPLITWSRVWHLVVLENWLIENKIED